MIMNKTDNKMKRFYFTIVALLATLVASAQTIKVYEYDDNGNLNVIPTFVSGKKAKVVFTDEKEHEYVDLGLPSGTLWATCNVGANLPEEYGLYFAWGETTGYTGDVSDGHEFKWENYKWCEGTAWSMTKYCIDSSLGTIDYKTELDPEDDAATVNWGPDWCMPTNEQQEELINPSYTDTEWTTLNGVAGCKITSKKNGNSIFLTPSGYRDYSSFYVAGSYGTYWSRSLNPNFSYMGLPLNFGEGNISAYNNCARYCGQSVRPVRAKK